MPADIDIPEQQKYFSLLSFSFFFSRLYSFAGGVPYPGWNEWKVVYELKVNKYRMPQPEHVSDELYVEKKPWFYY